MERFRYRSKISEHARSELRRFQNGSEISTNLKKCKWYGQVYLLANLPKNDEELPKPLEEARMPDGFWGGMYSLLFHKHLDRRISMTVLCLSGTLLLIGVAHEVSLFNSLVPYFSRQCIHLSFYFSILSLASPLLFVWAGSNIVKWATTFCSEQVSELEKLMQDDAQKAHLPDNIKKLN